MGDSEELVSKERPRRLIERLNDKEKLIGLHGRARADERGGAGSGDREAEDTECCPERFHVLESTFSILTRGRGIGILRTVPVRGSRRFACTRKPLATLK